MPVGANQGPKRRGWQDRENFTRSGLRTEKSTIYCTDQDYHSFGFFLARRRNCRMTRMTETSLSRHAMRVTSEHNFRLDERTLLLCTKKERE